MKKLRIALLAIALTASGCSAIYSTTRIEAKQNFVLGDNQHEAFEVSIKNISYHEVELSQKPNGGNIAFLQRLGAKKSVTLKIDKNTALYIGNKSNRQVAVKLTLESVSRLSMGYKN